MAECCALCDCPSVVTKNMFVSYLCLYIPLKLNFLLLTAGLIPCCHQFYEFSLSVVSRVEELVPFTLPLRIFLSSKIIVITLT